MENILHSRSGIAIKAALFIIIIGMLSSSSLKAQQCNCDHVISPPEVRATSVFVDGDKLQVKPGQTICLKSGFYMQIRFVRIFGEPGKPVTIINCGGPVQIGDSTTYGQWYAADIVNCKYIRLTGSGNNEYKYGITLGKSGDSGLKIGGLSTDTEIDHVEIANTGFAGILAKTDFGLIFMTHIFTIHKAKACTLAKQRLPVKISVTCGYGITLSQGPASSLFS